MPRRPPVLRVVPLLLLGVFVLSLVPPPTQAQTSPASSAVSSDHIHTYARAGRATQTVYVWGAVTQPGIWKIEPGTGLVELFSVVRPDGYGVETPDVQKTILLRIRRSTGGQPRIAHEMSIDELLEMPPDRRPSLQPQDILEVRTIENRKFNFQTVTSVVGTLSSLVLLGLRIFRP